MLQVLNGLDDSQFGPRVYVAAHTDRLAVRKAQQHEKRWAQQQKQLPIFSVRHIPRSREVGQSWLLSIISTSWAILAALWVVLRERPGCVLANGPGTCLPICFAARLYKLLGVLNVRIIFLESVARTENLSMTGVLLYHARVCDTFLVQWPALCAQYPRARCCGRVY
jgi:beta-1,4-N-acetylglucosaminyltransferase